MLINTSRIKALLLWLVEIRYAWFALGVIVVALVVSLRPQTPEPIIRLTGLVLQLLGIGTVIWGISETRALFGHPSFTAKAMSWFKRFPLLQRNIIATGAVSPPLATVKARGYVTHEYGTTIPPTLDIRVEALEKNIELIHKRISNNENEIDRGFRQASEALKNEGQARQTEDKAIREKLEVTGTGGIHISAIGASWLFVGVILSTAGIEIAEFLK